VTGAATRAAPPPARTPEEPPRASLQEIAGPVAVGADRRRFAELVYLVAVTDFKRSYFGTALGYVWSLVRPLLLFGVLLFVFTRIFRIGSGVDNYPVLLLFNIVVFGFFSESTSAAVMAIVAQEGIIRKTYFPRLAIPLAIVLTGLFNLGLNLVAVTIFILAYGVDPTWTWLLLPVFLAALTVFTVAVSALLSALYVRFRDVAIIWTVLVTVLFYATPVLYPFEKAPAGFEQLLMINPLTPLFQEARVWIIDPAAPNAVSAAGGWLQLLPALAVYLGTCALAVWVFRREMPRMAEEL
jgi:ABC-2 type transport system permease protein